MLRCPRESLWQPWAYFCCTITASHATLRPMSNLVSTFSFPTATLFGAGTVAELPARLKQMGCRCPLVVTDSGLVQTRAFEILSRTLDNTQLGKTWELFHGVHTNPIEQDVVDAANAFRAGHCDSVVAFG